MSKTIADLDINFTFENYISTIEYLYEFSKLNRHLINLEIKPGTYIFHVKYDFDFEECDRIQILVKCKMPLYNLIGRLNNIIFGLKETRYAIDSIVRLDSDYTYDLRLFEMPF